MGNETSELSQVDWSESAYENSCKKAAEAIAKADILLLATGAGFSQDSGLAVYKDIADIDAYHKMGVDYADLCVPDWIKKDPEIFFGFWGACYNDYRRVNPHDGYHIIRRWKEKFFHSETESAKLLQSILQSSTKSQKSNKNSTVEEELEVLLEKLSIDKEKSKAPGPFYIYTSNVDHHSIKAGFGQHEIYEIHGNTEYWQCSVPCKDTIWKAPKDYQFSIDKSTMRAKNDPIESTRVLPKGFTHNHPTCIHCGSLARPAILMFGDDTWVHDPIQSDNYYAWKDAVKKFLEKHPEKKMVILEIGCGIRVPSVRYQSEGYVSGHDNVTLVRVNPDYPLMQGQQHPQLISIRSAALKAIVSIDYHLKSLDKENNNNKPKKV
eukprot:TRINITY_DN104_c0_g1_i1.p1 TRINITY_DN104_c0_g1~~TRINITY_DN104_c0_g1_i1.p1  ORF type:complete len:379 (+),score=90.17 TRINITY_DN104_c0_g1_i1:117-1253(+)